MAEPFARERVLAIQFEKGCPLPSGKCEELAQLLAAYRQEVTQACEQRAAKQARRAI
jgi:hypothetical protein